MDAPLNRLQAFFAGRFRKRTAEWFSGGDIASQAAIQPGGDQVAATLPLDQHQECEEESPGEVGDFGWQHSFVRPGTISTQYFFRFECRKYHRGTGLA
jgi:hypothetical protein